VQREQFVLVEIGHGRAFGLRKQQPFALGQGFQKALARHHHIVAPTERTGCIWSR
jgi:hypothetical protein